MSTLNRQADGTRRTNTRNSRIMGFDPSLPTSKRRTSRGTVNPYQNLPEVGAVYGFSRKGFSLGDKDASVIGSNVSRTMFSPQMSIVDHLRGIQSNIRNRIQRVSQSIPTLPEPPQDPRDLVTYRGSHRPAKYSNVPSTRRSMTTVGGGSTSEIASGAPSDARGKRDMPSNRIAIPFGQRAGMIQGPIWKIIGAWRKYGDVPEWAKIL